LPLSKQLDNNSILTTDIPKTFDANHRPPEFNMVRDGLQAVMKSSLLSTSSFAMGVTGTMWLMDVGSLKEFAIMMKQKLGGAEVEKRVAQMPMDDETKAVEKALTDALK
jgi:hypothetical protein